MKTINPSELADALLTLGEEANEMADGCLNHGGCCVFAALVGRKLREARLALALEVAVEEGQRLLRRRAHVEPQVEEAALHGKGVRLERGRGRAGDHLDAYLESVGGDPSRSVVARGGARPDEAFYAAISDWRDSPLFDGRERLAIDYAERLAEGPRELGYDSAFWEEMRAAYSDAEIAELTPASSRCSGSSRRV